jgi:hypothetical protein
MVKSFFDSFTEDFHILVVHTISNSCSNSSKGSGGTAIFIIKTKGLKNYYPMLYRDQITMCFIVNRLPCVLSLSYYHVFYLDQITMFAW